jgi:tetratricopeptide (TPR) repeat protein
MKKITGLILCITVAMTLTAQNTEADSLKRILATTKEDTSHVLVLFELARYYEFFRPDTAMFYARQASQLANKLHFKKGEAKSLDEMAYLLTLTGNYPKALETAFKSLQINEEPDDQFGIAVNYNTLALIYIEQGDYRQALNYLFKSKAIVEKLKIESSIIIRNENIADVYEKMN